MDVSHVNWAYVGLAIFALLALGWVVRLRRTRPGPIAIVVSIALLVTAGLNAVAPWRGTLDPHYPGYVFATCTPRRDGRSPPSPAASSCWRPPAPSRPWSGRAAARPC
jgi:hypothetical protein